MRSEFRAFLVKTGALALAVGVILGTALGAVVSSLVADVILPPIGLVLGGVDFAALAITLKDTGDPETTVAIRYGNLINAIIVFIVVAFVVFWIGKAFIKSAPEPEPVDMRSCPYCLEQVPTAATKCRACGSAL